MFRILTNSLSTTEGCTFMGRLSCCLVCSASMLREKRFRGTKNLWNSSNNSVLSSASNWNNRVNDHILMRLVFDIFLSLWNGSISHLINGWLIKKNNKDDSYHGKQLQRLTLACVRLERQQYLRFLLRWCLWYLMALLQYYRQWIQSWVRLSKNFFNKWGNLLPRSIPYLFFSFSSPPFPEKLPVLSLFDLFLYSISQTQSYESWLFFTSPHDRSPRVGIYLPAHSIIFSTSEWSGCWFLSYLIFECNRPLIRGLWNRQQFKRWSSHNH